MNQNKALWEKGDFTQIAAFMRDSGEAVVQSLGVTSSMCCLDLGCGDGTTALPLAHCGAEVVGVDIATNLVDTGNARARRDNLSRLSFREGDACDLHDIADRTFDLTLSMFGAMFAPHPRRVAREMVRVTKPGGRIVMGNWIPLDASDAASFVSQLFRISSAFAPPPDDFVSPLLWGMESHVIERFGDAGIASDRIAMNADTFTFRSSDKNPTQFVDVMRQFFGPTMNAYNVAQSVGREDDLHQQLVAMANERNMSAESGTAIPATYLRVTVRL